MEVKYSNVADDLIAFTEHHLENNKPFQKTKKMNLYVAPLAICVIFSLLAYLTDRPMHYFGGASGALIIFLWSSYSYKNIAKKCALTAQKEVVCEHVVAVTEEGVLESTANSQSRIGWEAIDRIESNDSYIFIYNTPATAIVIPKRELGEDVFTELLAAIGNRANVPADQVQSTANAPTD